jgi:hypothetical protein
MRERPVPTPAACAGLASAGWPRTSQAFDRRSRRATRTSPAAVKDAYAVPLIDRSTDGSDPGPSATGADQPSPAGRATP